MYETTKQMIYRIVTVDITKVNEEGYTTFLDVEILELMCDDPNDPFIGDIFSRKRTNKKVHEYLPFTRARDILLLVENAYHVDLVLPLKICNSLGLEQKIDLKR